MVDIITWLLPKKQVCGRDGCGKGWNTLALCVGNHCNLSFFGSVS